MTEPIVRLEPTRVAVDPGGQVSVVVSVFNPGNRVEGYDVDIVSTTPMPWASVVPATLSVYPQQEDSAVVTFSPPAGASAPGGSFAFGVRVRSQVDAALSSVAEGDLDVGAVAGLQATLTPVTSSGRWSGRHTVTVTNWGNSSARLRIAPVDPDQALGFLVSPDVLDVALGAEAVARLKVRTRHPVLRGADQRLSFQVVCEPEEPATLGAPRPAMSTPDRPVVDGTFHQKPILTRAVVALAGVVLMAGIGGIAYAVVNSGGDGEEAVEDSAPNAPDNFVAVAEPDRVVLGWDRDPSVDSFVLEQTDPSSDRQEVNAVRDPDEPSRMQLKLAVETAETYCYQLRAVRGEAPESPPTAPPQCVQTVLSVEASGQPSPTADPTIDPLPPEPPAPESPPGGGSPSPGAPSPGATPDPFVAILRVYSPDSAGLAQAEAAAGDLLAAGVEARVLASDEWQFTPPLAAPVVLLVVDSTTEQGAAGECAAALTARPDLVPDGCLPALQRQVTPLGSPTPPGPTGPLAPSPAPAA